MTDSGGVQEEASALGVPCYTLRANTERPVTITHGTNVLLGDDPASLLDDPDRVAPADAVRDPAVGRPRGGPRARKRCSPTSRALAETRRRGMSPRADVLGCAIDRLDMQRDARRGRGADRRRALHPAHVDQRRQARDDARRRQAARDRRRLRARQRRRPGRRLGVAAARRPAAGAGRRHRPDGRAARPRRAARLPGLLPRRARRGARDGDRADPRAPPAAARSPARATATSPTTRRPRSAPRSAPAAPTCCSSR